MVADGVGARVEEISETYELALARDRPASGGGNDRRRHGGRPALGAGGADRRRRTQCTKPSGAWTRASRRTGRKGPTASSSRAIRAFASSYPRRGSTILWGHGLSRRQRRPRGGRRRARHLHLPRPADDPGPAHPGLTRSGAAGPTMDGPAPSRRRRSWWRCRESRPGPRRPGRGWRRPCRKRRGMAAKRASTAGRISGWVKT